MTPSLFTNTVFSNNPSQGLVDSLTSLTSDNGKDHINANPLLSEIDTIVVGGGIVGLATALF